MTTTSLSIDREKADAALTEIVNMDRRRRLVERVRNSERRIDTSAWNRSNANLSVSSHWTELALSGRVAICPSVRLELLISARGPGDYAAFADELDGLPSYPLNHRVTSRAEVVQGLLAERSRHRGPTAVDLLVAAIAEANDSTLLHYERHFDAIARVTGQPAEWIARRGTLD